jgi:hypothetical protein
MNYAQEVLLSLNGFCFSSRKILFIWLFVFVMLFEFEFMFLVINIVFSNFTTHLFQGLLNYAFVNGWTFFFRPPHSHQHWDDVSFSINSQHIKRFDQYFSSLLIYNHTYMIMRIVTTNLMHHLYIYIIIK